jgi:hypothetical protein
MTTAPKSGPFRILLAPRRTRVGDGSILPEFPAEAPNLTVVTGAERICEPAYAERCPESKVVPHNG